MNVSIAMNVLIATNPSVEREAGEPEPHREGDEAAPVVTMTQEGDVPVREAALIVPAVPGRQMAPDEGPGFDRNNHRQMRVVGTSGSSVSAAAIPGSWVVMISGAPATPTGCVDTTGMGSRLWIRDEILDPCLTPGGQRTLKNLPKWS